MPSYALYDRETETYPVNITTWGRNEAGEQVWRARDGRGAVEFVCPRDAEQSVLFTAARQALADATEFIP